MGPINLGEGVAHYMGDGVFVLCQQDAERGPQSVVVTEDTLQRLRAALG